jgi:toxin CptA
LALLAVFSLLASDLPRTLAWPLALLAAGWGLGEARSYARQPSRAFLIPAGAGEACCDGARMDALQVLWRGPLAFLRWCDPTGATRRLAFFPDTLPAATRRELRLAMQRREAAVGTVS